MIIKTLVIQYLFFVPWIVLGIKRSKSESRDKIIDNILFYEQIGTVLEPSGQYNNYAGTIVIPFVYSLPTNTTNLANCNLVNKMTKVYQSLIEHTKSIIEYSTPKSVKTRKKRFVPLLIGGATIAQGIYDVYNTYSQKTLQERISVLETYKTTIDKQLGTLTSTTNLLINRTQHISMLVNEHAIIIQRLIASRQCSELENSPEVISLYSTMNLMVGEFIETYNSAAAGSITHNLITPANHHHLVHTHPELKDTLYAEDPSLLYEVGKVGYISCHLDKIPSIRGVILLPKIISKVPYPVYNVITVNFYHNSHDSILQLPKQLVCTDRYTCKNIEHSRCLSFQNRVLCMEGSYQENDRCIASLKSNTSLQACDIQVRTQGSTPVIYQMGSGVLLGAHKTQFKTLDMVGTNIIYKNPIEPNKKPQIITPAIAPYMLIHDQIYSTVQSGVNLTITPINVVLPNIIHSESVELTDNWTDPIPYIPTYQPLLNIIRSSYAGYFLFCLHVLITILILTAYHKYYPRSIITIHKSVPEYRDTFPSRAPTVI